VTPELLRHLLASEVLGAQVAAEQAALKAERAEAARLVKQRADAAVEAKRAAADRAETARRARVVEQGLKNLAEFKARMGLE
jgi:hypothetical protein